MIYFTKVALIFLNEGEPKCATLGKVYGYERYKTTYDSMLNSFALLRETVIFKKYLVK